MNWLDTFDMLPIITQIALVSIAGGFCVLLAFTLANVAAKLDAAIERWNYRRRARRNRKAIERETAKRRDAAAAAEATRRAGPTVGPQGGTGIPRKINDAPFMEGTIFTLPDPRPPAIHTHTTVEALPPFVFAYCLDEASIRFEAPTLKDLIALREYFASHPITKRDTKKQ